MSRALPNNSLKRCNQPRPISAKLLDKGTWNSDRVLITSSPFKQWAKWGAICSCFAWNSTACEGLKYLAFHHVEQCGETDRTVLECKCLYLSNKPTDIRKQCSAQGTSQIDPLILWCQGHPLHKAKDWWPFFLWWSSEKPFLPSLLTHNQQVFIEHLL